MLNPCGEICGRRPCFRATDDVRTNTCSKPSPPWLWHSSLNALYNAAQRMYLPSLSLADLALDRYELTTTARETAEHWPGNQ